MQTWTLQRDDGHHIQGRAWPAVGEPRAVVVISHGLSEHGARYAPMAEALAHAGYTVYAYDHRGHGTGAAVPGWLAAEGGWQKLVDDLAAVCALAERQVPERPVVLFGHSMGSFVARQCFVQYGRQLAALVLSATGYRQAPLAHALRALSRLCGRWSGPQQPSVFLTRLVFGSFNLGFWPAHTPLDWLSRDRAAVAAYQADPLCGAPPSAGLWADLFGGIIELERLERRPLPLPRIPVYLVAGSRDPVSLGRFGLGQLARRYRSHGVSDVTVRVYRGGRHEMHNETNRHEVLADLLAWLNSRLRQR
ncbi:MULTISPECIES: alpha/beta fold hydrolase [Gulbenkiania]|uniref:Lysophospholipase, alpha-beta hydrolase superfamily n=2 Tax=Gulbenkiania TaxID=397456 RepID=A0A0K6GYT1_9NEIS|nr:MULTISPECIES: alpha/beta fold hydrolase [Gulbenkiania]TCW32792.1 alpha-beta hydrolase superfamily lysophospholipase [Gulbenkiania mobilis]CUA83658.1 Lysophospholipase, alpha-beta hydrolase superfamily [Gulbenkiania indica]